MNLSARLDKRLSGGFALRVEFSVPPGITMLFGESGSGKTTVLRCVAGLLRPESGRITIGECVLFDSAQPVDMPVPERHVGFVFQSLALFPHLTVAENVQYGLAGIAGSQMNHRVRNILESFRISTLADRKPNEISGGERQRVALARTLVTNPRILLLDEPLAALDYATQSSIIDDIRAWNAAHNIPILYVTHSKREVFALGERIIALQEGVVIGDGTPQDVLDAPTHETLAQLSGFENFFDATVLSANPDSGTMQCRLENADTTIEVPLAKAKIGAAIRFAIRAGDIIIATELPRALSARNIVPGTITRLKQEGTRVIAHVEAGRIFEVHLTPVARETLNLMVGQEIWLVIKTYSCHLLAQRTL